MNKKERHHILPKEIQQKTLNVPFNNGIYDETTVPLDEDFHHKVTHRIRFEGIPAAYTLGEIDRELLENEYDEEDD